MAVLEEEEEEEEGGKNNFNEIRTKIYKLTFCCLDFIFLPKWPRSHQL